MMHGIGGHSTDFDGMISSIQQVLVAFTINLKNKYHPGTEAVSLDLYNGDDSFLSLHIQLPNVIKTIQALNYDSFHLVCHSQGSFSQPYELTYRRFHL